MDQERLDEMTRAVRYHPDWYPMRSRVRELLEHIEEQDAKIVAAHTSLDRWRSEYKRWTVQNSENFMKLRPHLNQLKVENEQLREAVKIAAQICRLQRKNWYGETGDDEAYESWTKQIEYFEGLADADQKRT